MNGILLGLIVLLTLIALVMVAANVKFRRDCRAGAEKIHREMTGVFAGEHEYRVLEAGGLPGLPRDGYERVAADLGAEGFRPMGAFEDLTVSAVYPANRSYFESHLAPDGATAVSTYFVPQLGKQVVDIGTAFEDGRMVATTTAALDTLRPPVWMLREALAVDTAVGTVLTRHRQRLAEFREQWPDVAPVPVQTREDVVRWAADHSRRTAEFRRSIGWLTEAEMMSFARSPQERLTAEHMWTEFQAIVAREKARASGG